MTRMYNIPTIVTVATLKDQDQVVAVSGQLRSLARVEPLWVPQAASVAGRLATWPRLAYYLVRLQADLVVWWPSAPTGTPALARLIGKRVLPAAAILAPESALAALREALPALTAPVTRIELGCGNTGLGGTLGVDRRRTPTTRIVCDVRQLCFSAACADEVYAICVLEHVNNPHEVSREIVRILRPNGRAFVRVPNLGTFSAHMDPTHCFLADLSAWKTMLRGYFGEVKVVPVDTKYRDSLLLKLINLTLVHVCGFYELTQGWTFICSGKRVQPAEAYIGWWMEGESET
jgi:hypothetical protein